MSDQLAFVWDAQFYPVTGVSKVDFTADVRNVQVVGAGAGLSLKPAVQYAAIRTDRPAAGALITDGQAITGNDLKHFQETLSGSTEFFFRRGVGYQLTGTGGTFARAQGLLYTAFNTFGQVLPAQEIVFNPTNGTSAVSVFPLGGGRAIVAQGVSAAKLVVVTMGNLNNTMQCRLAGRAFNDPLARGDWTLLEAAWRTPASGDDGANTGEVVLTGLSLASYQWLELGLAVRKAADTDPVSRVIFHVIPALKYSV